jgi:hypothetical protein
VATTLANWIRDEQSKKAAVHGDAATGEPPTSAPPSPAWSGSPFPGLRALTPADAPIFFGRDHETGALVRKLFNASCRFLLVTGASGSGKSSLVAAGLLPRLREDAIPGSSAWLLPDVESVGRGLAWLGLRFTPGELGPDPFQALSGKLAPMLPDAPSAREVAQELDADPSTLVRLVERALAGRDARAEALLFVDQFEEMVTVVAEERQARFVEMLAAASQSSRLRIVGTIRADFYHRCIEAQPLLAGLLLDRGAIVPLAVPGYPSLMAMIEGPARRAGLRFEDGLVEQLADQTVSRPGGLALLAFALHELYEARQDDGLLTRAAFDRFGGLTGVINTRAETTLARLPQAARDRLGPVFGQLVVVDEHGVATRHRAPREEVVGSSADAAQLVAAFEQARLLVSDSAPDGASVLEVAHEALLREWQGLTGWIRERADDLRLMRQVETAAREWARQGHAPHYAWPHERLVPVYQALERLGRRDDLHEPERSFVRPEWERLLAELERAETMHPRRAEIGDRLDAIGDPRPGVGVNPDGTPDIVWCDIPGGTVVLEKVEGEFDVSPFRIAKYPVTHRQYRAFVEAPDGYHSPGPWAGLHHNYPSGEYPPGEQYRPIGDHAAENVSWYDAVAFCRWLSRRLALDVRLPDEWEWQQAATSGDRRNAYPWGADWDDSRANTWESRLGRTIAVGMYPRGRSAQEAMDLSGNLREWCRNEYEDPRGRTKPESGGRRVLRGGSWNFARENARAAYRNDLDPGYRSYFIGFRVVCVSPIC